MAGRLAVNCSLSIRVGQGKIAEIVGPALDGAAIVARLGGTAYLVGCTIAELDRGLGLDTAAVDGLTVGAASEEGKRLWHFEIDGGEEELRFELHPLAAARALLASTSSKDVASVSFLICYPICVETHTVIHARSVFNDSTLQLLTHSFDL